VVSIGVDAVWSVGRARNALVGFENCCVLLEQHGNMQQQLQVLRETTPEDVIEIREDGLLVVSSLGATGRGPYVTGQIFHEAFSHIWRERLGQHAGLYLWRQNPLQSARLRLSSAQRNSLVFGVLCLAAIFVLIPTTTLSSLYTLLFAVFVTLTLPKAFAAAMMFRKRGRKHHTIRPIDLPTYTVMVPLLRETAVLPNLLRALQQFHYPSEKLDIKLLVEENDLELLRALRGYELPPYIRACIVPQGKPQTKPRALNYGLLLARGEITCIYDAEDVPEPHQLLDCALTFASAAQHVACLQARLLIFNSRESWLTRQFALEYAVWFGGILPALAKHGWTVPLGGTSNHFRTEVLRKLGGWDPHNVTEDADLGLRLARAGYRVQIINSRTFEEAPPSFSVWLKQRSRWIKGYLQTSFVHGRDAFRTIAKIGVWRWWQDMCMTFGSVVTTLLHPLLTLGFFVAVIAAPTAIMPDAFEALGIGLLALCYLINGLLGYVFMRREYGRADWRALLTFPLYWLLLGLPAIMAVAEFFWRPHHWHKTPHGVSRQYRLLHGVHHLDH
jgi:cellulose synthase/poly-beta-1,6-N-acetylglucosamine synthase-like glycosyltransferase